MMFTTLTTEKNEYKLVLTTSAICQLEKKIGCNPLSIFDVNGEELPTVSVMIAVLHASLQKFQHGITEVKAYDIFDEWLASGHVMTDFVQVILDIYDASGLIKLEKN